MTKTIVYLAHPDVAGSSSQQFLQQSGLALTEVSYVDLQAEYEANGQNFDASVELARLTRLRYVQGHAGRHASPRSDGNGLGGHCRR